MKYNTILEACESFLKEAQRKKGRSLPESGYKERYVNIYRAVPATVNHFFSMDYVTLSRRWAKGHAEHNVVTLEEPQHVMTAMVKASDVYEAGNPGEYFYDGPEKKGQIIFVANP